MTVDPLANVERLLDDVISDVELEFGGGRPHIEAREAVRLLLDVARDHPFNVLISEAQLAYDNLFAFARSLDGDPGD